MERDEGIEFSQVHKAFVLKQDNDRMPVDGEVLRDALLMRGAIDAAVYTTAIGHRTLLSAVSKRPSRSMIWVVGDAAG